MVYWGKNTIKLQSANDTEKRSINYRDGIKKKSSKIKLQCANDNIVNYDLKMISL